MSLAMFRRGRWAICPVIHGRQKQNILALFSEERLMKRSWCMDGLIMVVLKEEAAVVAVPKLSRKHR